jgi:hypothetical protein
MAVFTPFPVTPNRQVGSQLDAARQSAQESGGRLVWGTNSGWFRLGGTTGSSMFPQLVRQNSATALLIKRLLKKRRVPGEDEEAALCWGGPSNFTSSPTTPSVTPPTQPGGGGGVVDDEDDDLGACPTAWEEVDKETEDVRIENPEDPEDYVIVQRRTRSQFQTPNGFVCITWDNDDLGGTPV